MPSRPSKPKLKPSLQFEALGTAWEISALNGIPQNIAADIHHTLEQIDRAWSRFRSDSIVARMSQEIGTYPLNPAEYDLLYWYQLLYNATNGAVTPLIGQTLADAGYDRTYSLQPQETIAQTPAWDDCLQLQPGTLEILRPALLDVGAAGKGWAIDQIAFLLGDTFVIDAGGDILMRGQTETIGLEHPLEPGKAIGVVQLTKGSICGSAGNRRIWGVEHEWHHILDPRTSKPVQDVIATWIIADTAMQADGLATALFFVSPEKLQSIAKFDYIVMYADGSVRHSSHKGIQLFTA